ncbi:class I SAM-dependent methyltransferase [Paraclostridium bifermentans]|uniref:class I SAM-dependent methyltransferase n=1 Tax=Paraclostridium bifermentans TaxID=1490 RepID=UPI00241D1D94|nr:class I SAM-dependent methyltransferase [Paraclostridium bifermentans]
MHYKINDKLIKSEYAAKSIKQANKEVLKIINELPNDIVTLDYGCGKLRYTIHLSKKVKHVYSVDSNEQINRKQLIKDAKTTVKDYSNRLDNVTVFSLEDNGWKKNKYDFIICCNVLSAIPIYRERIVIFKNIKKLLSNNGKALISTQYSNSYFNEYKIRKDCKKYYDGWIINGKKNTAFYGIITLEKMIYYATKVGLNVEKSYKKNGSAYLIVNINNSK